MRRDSLTYGKAQTPVQGGKVMEAEGHGLNWSSSHDRKAFW
jgi:hypothetical protein